MRLIRTGALVCACAVLACGAAVAEEKRLGDYIYVPAMSVQGNMGAMSLRVEALAISRDGAPQEIDALAGAEFGVYVYSSEGVLTPWANPLYPSEPMRIRTGEGETSFTLPQGTEFYLKQESAPEGYAFDADALIPVTGDEIVVRNEMAGQLVLTVQDRLGSPIAGVTLTVTDEAGNATAATTDAAGQATLAYETAQRVTVEESALPAGLSAAQGVYVDGGEAAAGAVGADVAMATRTRVVFEHPATGSVQLEMTLAAVDERAQEIALPLGGVTMEILGDSPVTLTTDEQGRASASLLEGTYDVRFAYAGEEDAVLPALDGRVVVSGGETTAVQMVARPGTGRVAALAVCGGEPVSGAKMTLVSEATGETFGPYAMDGEGLALSEALAPGRYSAVVEAPEHMELAALSCGNASQEDGQTLTLTVEAGELARVDAQMLRREIQTFELLVREIGDTGEREDAPIAQTLELELIDEAGQAVAQLSAENGRVRVEAVAGTYALRMASEDALALGVAARSETFTLPALGEAVAFDGVTTRIVIASTDENGRPIPGAVYVVTDGTGRQEIVACDENGEAVTSPLAPGSVRIVTRTAPEGYDVSAEVEAEALSGEAARIEIAHARYGMARFDVRLQSLDGRGNLVLTPLGGAGIRLYSLSGDGRQMEDTGVTLKTGEDGTATARLAPGEYAAQVEEAGMPEGSRFPQALRFTMENGRESGGELICMDALGGVRAQLTGGELSDEELAQVRFELVYADGQTVGLTMQGGVFYAGDLEAGTYVLRQTQIPQGYTLAAERTVSVSGGEAVRIDVPLEEYAVLSVSKTGLTFNENLQTYVVPLTGEYGIYTMEGGQLKPYPSAAEQETVWSNVAQDGERASRVKLPAAVEGTTYYLLEKGEAAGFLADTQAHEITLYAGQTRVLTCGVSSDRGFFTLDVTDVSTGERVPGGEYELVDAGGEAVLTFAMEDGTYQNEMAVPVGTYTLRQKKAAAGYALCDLPEVSVDVPAYLDRGGSVATVSMTCLALPKTPQMDEMIVDLYAASEQGLTLVSVDGGALRVGESLILPQTTVRVESKDGGRVNVASIVLSGAGDGDGGRYAARVEYCLAGGGWQPSDARMTGVLDGPTAMSFTDVEDDICAVRVTYVNAETGEEAAGSAFTPGQLTLNVQASAQGETSLYAQAEFIGSLEYRERLDDGVQRMARSAQRELDFTAQGGGMFDTVSAGRDGKISGVAFFDEDADGVLSAGEAGRYAGLTVSLIARSGEVVATARTDADGRYVFDTISSGAYTVQFDAGDAVVFSASDRYSEHVSSGVRDAKYGMSDEMRIDGDHTDYVVNAGCIYAASLSGRVSELLADGQTSGFGGLCVEMRPAGQEKWEEPAVVLTNDLGEFSFTGVMPGAYEVKLILPEGYLCDTAEYGVVAAGAELAQGDAVSMGDTVIRREAVVSGAVRVDDDGDGIVDARAQTLSGVRVILLEARNGHTRSVAETVSGEDGSYRFGELDAGSYSVLFELSGEWTFTRFGRDSDVYGAVSQSGSTQVFDLATGETATGVDAGVTIPAQLGVTVFQDTRMDGQMSPYEPGLEGVNLSLIRLEDGEDAEEVMLKTDAEGSALFAGVSPGEYVLAYQLPGQWRATVQADAGAYPVSCVPQSTLSSGRSEPFMLSMGQSGLRQYIGAALSGSISGVVYEDDDADAQLGAQEALCEGVRVELLDAQGNVCGEATSAQDGSYAFEGLAAGRYRLRFTAWEGCGFSGTERTAARGGAQASETPVSETRVIAVVGGEATTTADAGVVRLNAVSGSLWQDRNANMARDAGETGMAGVTVHLMNGTGRTILSSVQTDEQGGFAFDGLMPDDYVLRVDAPEDYVFSGAQEGSPLPLESQKDGRGYSAAFTVLGGAQVENIGYGLLTQGTISGRVWNDADYDGVMDEEEEGLRGVQVALLDADGEQVAQAQTPRSGEFEFDSLMPGAYALRVTLEGDAVYTVGGGDSLVPRGDGLEATLPLGDLPMGGAIGGVNIGALTPASVGGTVWYDADNDGRRQPGDAGSRAKVTLRVLDGSDAGTVLETAADETGAYRFDGVMPGSVQLTFELEDGLAFAKRVSGTKRVSCVPQADAATAQTDSIAVKAGSNLVDIDAGVVGVGVVGGVIWEDSVYDGLRGADERGVPGAQVTLTDAQGAARTVTTDESGAYVIDFVRMGEYSVSVSLPEGMMFTTGGEAIAMTDEQAAATAPFALAMGESRTGLDAGAIVPAVVTGRVGVDENENGVCDSQEEGLSDAVVTLTQGGTVVAATKTQQDGSFVLDALRPGAYRIRIALPQDALFAHGVNLELAQADAQEGQTQEFTLAMGQQTALDAVAAVRTGIVAGRAWADADTDGAMDADEAPLTGTFVELLDMNDGGRTIASADVDENGQYTFGLLRSGTYAVRFTLPDGELFADRAEGEGTSSVQPVPGGVATTPAFTLAMGEERRALNVGGIRPGEIGDTVWLDVNGNGLQDYREPLLPDVGITLLRVESDGQTSEAAVTTSDAYGYYRFGELRPGTYRVRFDAQPGDVLTDRFGAPLGEIDSDIDPETGLSDAIRLTSGQTIRHVDIGLTERAGE